jgi:hypothetical protein
MLLDHCAGFTAKSYSFIARQDTRDRATLRGGADLAASDATNRPRRPLTR